jgi:hypothetical protein
MSWITTSQPPLIVTPNWCGEKCVTKASQNWRHKARLVNRYNGSPTAMGWIPPKGLVMAKRRAISRTCAIWGRMWPSAIWKIKLKQLKQSTHWIFKVFEGVQKPSQKDHLLINATCIRTLTWRNWKKVWGLGVARNLQRKTRNSHLIWGVMRWELRWC